MSCGVPIVHNMQSEICTNKGGGGKWDLLCNLKSVPYEGGKRRKWIVVYVLYTKCNLKSLSAKRVKGD